MCPLYDYKCQVCGKVFETLVPAGTTMNIECDCGSRNVERQVSKWGNYAIHGDNTSSTTPKGKGDRNVN